MFYCSWSNKMNFPVLLGWKAGQNSFYHFMALEFLLLFSQNDWKMVSYLLVIVFSFFCLCGSCPVQFASMTVASQDGALCSGGGCWFIHFESSRTQNS